MNYENELLRALTGLENGINSLKTKLAIGEIRHADDIDRDYVRQLFLQWNILIEKLTHDWRHRL